MKVPVLLTLSGLALLTSCGSDTTEPGDEGPISPPPFPFESNAPRLVTPTPLPSGQPQNYLEPSIFRVPDVTQELPEEKALLSHPVSSRPAASVNSNSR